MKKLLSLILSISLLVCCFSVSAAEAMTTTEAGHELMRMIGLEIIKDGEIQKFDETKIVTRAELSCALVRFLNMEDVSKTLNLHNAYTDISDDYWAAGHIALCKKMGIFGNVNTNAFYPDKPVTLEEAVNMTVWVLGYTDVIKTNTASYSVYTDLLKGLDINLSTPLNHRTLIKLLDNALDTEIVSPVVFNDGDVSLKVSGITAFEMYFPKYFKVRGVVRATGETALTGTGVKNGAVLIGDKVYNAETVGIDMLGKSVLAYGKEIDEEYFLTAVFEDDSRNRELFLEAADIKSVSGKTVAYSDENGRSEKLTLSPTVNVVYNGSPAAESELLKAKGSNSVLTFIDNDADNKYDVVIIEFCEYTTVKSINSNLNIIYFEKNVLNGKNYVEIEESYSSYVSIYDETGELSDISKIEPKDVVSISHSRDGRRIGIRVLEKLIITPNEISPDGTVGTENAQYTVRRGISNYDDIMKKFQPDTDYIVFVDANGYIVYVSDEEPETGFKYGYIYDKAIANEVEDCAQLQILSGTYGKVKKNENTSAYTLEGESEQQLTVYELSSKVKLNNSSLSAKKAYAQLNVGDVIRYKLDENERIRTILISGEAGQEGNRNLNCKSQVFGGITKGAFGFDEDTIMFFVPQSGNPDDTKARISLKNSTAYKVQGFDMRQKEYAVDAAVINVDMKLYETIEFGKNAPLSIIYKKSRIIDENGLFAYKLYGYTNGVEFEHMTDGERPDVNDAVHLINAGDIVHMAFDFNGKITQILKIASVNPGSNYYHTGKNSSSEKVFAALVQADEKDLGPYDTEYYNRLTINAGDGVDTIISVQYVDGPPMYIYDSERRIMMPCSFDDIASLYYKDLFIYLQSSVAKIVVAVR